jgi:hypothetical protein
MADPTTIYDPDQTDALLREYLRSGGLGEHPDDRVDGADHIRSFGGDSPTNDLVDRSAPGAAPMPMNDLVERRDTNAPPPDWTGAMRPLSAVEQFVQSRGQAPMYSSRGFSPTPHGTGSYSPGEFDLPTSPNDERFAAARRMPSAQPDADWQSPEASGAWQAAHRPQPMPTPDTLGTSPSAVQEPRYAGRTQPSIGAPPPVQENSDQLGNVLAMFLDLATNRGRNLGVMTGAMLAPGKDVPYENWKRQAGAAKLNADLAASARRGLGDPETLDLRRQQLQLERERTQAMLEAAKARGDIAQGKSALEKSRNDPNDPMAISLGKSLYALGAPRGSLDGLSTSQMEKLAPTLVAPGTSARDVQKAIAIAQGTAEARQPYEMEQIEARAENQKELAADRAENQGTGGQDT